MAQPVGRPVEASQTKDEALARYYSKQLPKRPRNTIERDVMRKRAGRKVNPLSPTREAAQFALWLLVDARVSLREASRRAAMPYKVKPDSVRKLAKTLLAGPQVELTIRIEGMYRQLVGDDTTRVPLLCSVEDAHGPLV